MIDTFVQYINDHEDWLMGRILKYAQQRDYTKYTSTLKEAWRLSISGLSKSLVELIEVRGDDIELGPKEDYTRDPATQFGIIEARRHRERGISLEMFLGLMKYYHQSYQDLIKESQFTTSEKQYFVNLINRFFDRVEISFCTAWASSEQDQLVDELQDRNRQMTNEKNKYLTIFESLSEPVFIVSPDGNIENMNLAASRMFNINSVSGSGYYTDNEEKLVFAEEFPWLAESYAAFVWGKEQKQQGERTLNVNEQYFHISFSRSLDISGKFSEIIVIIADITKRKKLENDLEKLATTDPLTGAKNRRAFLQLFEQELDRSQRYDHKFSLLMLDIDHFKNINDTHGHDSGDKVLKLLVAEIYGILRATDMFGRWGGEEFIILLPESNIHQASTVAERLRGNLSKIEVSTDDGALIKFTVSIGMTVVENNDVLLDGIIKKADQALYLAKDQGRNRVVIL
ncbi:diguanylate cyclase (GGDEF) domain-containing protein [Desulfocapsa sulfexigens DSM 10523]|uniref:diguanylate cyclase n=1 Tax=Desulfocapsa sulfexigens (strain DSM 10523 / SB164P1) TaxID=1167006 RepID=M1P3B6_DESSD|nr:sensor domain-containing diguanylate cyclase [Desulfocapsa sulfexigens]AGF77953.1 diguanylate cyclase (GGDEF) domain-containing protein [Desulfocapsa sulfexigens DSM 10523]